MALKKTTRILILIILISCCFMIGTYVQGQLDLKNAPIIIEKPMPYSVDKLVYIDKPVEVEKIVTENITLVPRYFASIKEARTWIDDNRLPIVFYAGNDGTIDFNGLNYDSRYDCDNYAEDFEMLAIKSGYRIWQAPVFNGRIWNIKVTSNSNYHIGCMTRIDNTYYYIETSPSTTQWKLVKLIAVD